MESDSSLRYISVERQSQEDLPRHPLVHKPWHVLEAKSHVVIRMPHETAALSISLLGRALVPGFGISVLPAAQRREH
jgi:hypothetical protein